MIIRVDCIKQMCNQYTDLSISLKKAITHESVIFMYNIW